MRFSVRNTIEKIFPKIIAKKIIFAAKVTRHTCKKMREACIRTIVPAAALAKHQENEHAKRQAKRFSFSEGNPFTKDIHNLGTHFKIVVDPFRNGLVDEEIADTGKWEEGLGCLFLKYLKVGDTFVDIGANIGFHSLFAAAHMEDKGEVHSFEPLSHLCSQIKKSIDANNFTSIKVHHTALSDVAGEGEIHLLAENTGGSSLLFNGDHNSSVEKVHISRLDEILSVEKPVHVIKIDVEGYEYEALKGGENILRKWKPIIFLEFSPMFYIKESPLKPYKLIAFLESLGYAFSTLEEKPFNIKEWTEEVYNDRTQIEVICKPK